MNKDYAEKRKVWLEKNGFGEDLVTYVYFPADSYDVKEELKNEGFIFSKILFWHSPILNEKYAEKVLRVELSEVAEISAWGEGYFKENAKEYIEKKMFDARGEKEGEWLGDPVNDIGSRVQVRARLVSITEHSGKYGTTQLVRFIDELGNEINWWTTVDIKVAEGTLVDIKAIIKNFNRYKNKKITVLKNCKLTEVL